MAEQKDKPLSPTVKKVLDAYRSVLHADETIDDEAVDRLSTLLQKGTVPKFDEIDMALLPSLKEDKP